MIYKTSILLNKTIVFAKNSNKKIKIKFKIQKNDNALCYFEESQALKSSGERKRKKNNESLKPYQRSSIIAHYGIRKAPPR
jgi:hypothetical protein